jgi:hypothetical protein
MFFNNFTNYPAENRVEVHRKIEIGLQIAIVEFYVTCFIDDLRLHIDYFAAPRTNFGEGENFGGLRNIDARGAVFGC